MWSGAVTYAFANKCIRDDTRSLRWPNLAEKKQILNCIRRKQTKNEQTDIRTDKQRDNIIS